VCCLAGNAGLSGWVTDRLYEAGAEDTLSLAGDASLSIPDTGKWTALAVLLGVQFGAAAWGFLSPPRITIQGINNLSDKASSKDSPDEKKQKLCINRSWLACTGDIIGTVILPCDTMCHCM